MSEPYTPITEDVRDTYVEGRWEMFPDSKRDDLYWASEFDRWLAKHETETIRKAIAYLKTTPAVTLVGKGGAYELLEAYAQRLEEENG